MDKEKLDKMIRLRYTIYVFIREVTHLEKKNNTEYSTYKIVESVRTKRGPRQRVLLNLGAGFNLPKEQWKELSRRIEEIVAGQEPLFSCSEEIEAIAKNYARKIIKAKSSFTPPREDKNYIPDYQTIDVNSVENEDARTVGAEHVVYHTIKELNLDEKLLKLGFNKLQLQIAIGVISARLIDPKSERATHIWLQNISAIDELLGTDFSNLSQYRVYNVSDMLLKHKQEIEEHLSFKERHLFRLEEKIILYDLTNTFFEGSGRYNSKAHFGHSKDRQQDSPLVTLGLVLDSDGFPKRSKVFSGNISEPKTLKEMIDRLNNGSLIKPIIVFDAGIATEKNIEWLKGEGYFYLVVSRKKKRDIPKEMNMVTIREDEKEIVRLGLKKNNNELNLYCYSQGKAEKEKGIKNLFSQRFEEELDKARAALSKRGGTKQYDKVIERIGRLKERFKRISHRYKIEVKKDNKTHKAIDITWQRKEMEKTEGVYCLRTNIEGIKEQKIWEIYNMLREIEDAFCCMKSDLGLRPVYHQIEKRVDGHLFITVLAYHILHAIRFKLMQNGINYDWETIRTLLSTHIRITTTMKRKDGKTIHIRKSSCPELFHRKIYNALSLPCRAGKTIKTIL